MCDKPTDDASRDLVLYGEDVHQLAIVPIGPQVGSAAGIDQLGRNADAVAAFAHAPFHEIPYTQLPRYLPKVFVNVAIDKRRVARDHEQRVKARQICDDVFADAIAEILLLGIAAHVLERQHGDRRLVGEGERRCWRLSGLGRFRSWRGLRRPIGFLPLDPEGPDGALNVLECQLTKGVQSGLEAPFDGLAHGS